MKVAFRADASVQMGSGHIIRCLALATQLRKRGAETLFVSREGEGDLCGFLERHGQVVARLAPEWGGAWQEDAENTSNAIADWGIADWLVVDHYRLEHLWEIALRRSIPRILVVDDLADRPHDCDVLLDQNLTAATGARYDSLVPKGCRTLLGPRFALLRLEFSKVRSAEERRTGADIRLFVFFGGADSANETAKALHAVDLLKRPNISVDVVLGESNPHREEIEFACSKLERVALHVQVEDIAELMRKANLALGAGGGALLERCAVGLPSVVVSVAANQVGGCAALARLGAIQYLGPAETVTAEAMRNSIVDLLRSPERLEKMSEAASGIVDGEGVERVAQVLFDLRIELRRAIGPDCDSIWAWRNDESTRRFSSDPQPVEIDRHRLWFGRTLRDPNRDLLVGEDEAGPIGVVRFDADGDDVWISVYLVPGRRGRGLGTPLLAKAVNWIRQTRPEVRRILAKILSENAPSIRAFGRVGFVEVGPRYVLQLRGD